MIDVIINSYNEPKSTLKAANIFLNQYKEKDMRVIVVDPFPEVEEFLNKNIKDKRFHFYLDPGEGKATSLNMIFQEFNSNNSKDIFILTDGDVYVSDNVVEEILKAFKNSKVGCVTGKPASINSRENMYGYWSKFLYAGIDSVRKKISKQNSFLQCSGYLFALRKGLVYEICPDVPEDCIIPYYVWKKGYSIEYLPSAEVYIKYPDNYREWVKQRVRTIKAHENISKLYPDMPRTKSLLREVKEGLLFIFKFPKNLKEYYWTFLLCLARLHIYFKAFGERDKKAFSDGWREEEISSTRMED